MEKNIHVILAIRTATLAVTGECILLVWSGSGRHAAPGAMSSVGVGGAEIQGGAKMECFTDCNGGKNGLVEPVDP